MLRVIGKSKQIPKEKAPPRGPTFTFSYALPRGVDTATAKAACLEAVRALGGGGK